MIKKDSRQIICTSFSNGKCHDFNLFKQSRLAISSSKNVKVDSGYQGLQKYHANSNIPNKSTKNNPLSTEDKQKNSLLSSERIYNEHVIGSIKIFRIIAERYRNRRKRFGLRFNLIAGLYNLELG